MTQMLKEVLTDSPDPVDGVRAFVEAVAHVLRDSGYVFGCPVALIVLDSPESSALARSAGGKRREEGTSSLPGSCSGTSLLVRLPEAVRGRLPGVRFLLAGGWPGAVL